MYLPFPSLTLRQTKDLGYDKSLFRVQGNEFRCFRQNSYHYFYTPKCYSDKGSFVLGPVRSSDSPTTFEGRINLLSYSCIPRDLLGYLELKMFCLAICDLFTSFDRES